MLSEAFPQKVWIKEHVFDSITLSNVYGRNDQLILVEEFGKFLRGYLNSVYEQSEDKIKK